MKAIKYLLMSLLTISFALSSYSQTNKEIILALKTGNSTELSKFFISNVELIIGEKEGVYSKSQALVILKNFYKQNKPQNFSILHEGGKDGAKYVIGNLKTNKSIYRVYFLIKKQGQKSYIHTLRIEEE
jgi:hypothetical protein